MWKIPLTNRLLAQWEARSNVAAKCKAKAITEASPQ